MNLNSDRPEQPMRLLGVFAHPDDEVFCAGGTMAQWADAGNEVMIVSATRGEAGQIQDAYAATRRTLGAVREQELRDACAELGAGRVECLDYCDGALAQVDPERLAADVAAFIRAFQPHVIVTFGPDGGSGHPDHIAISVATTLACQLVAREDGWAPSLYYSAFPKQHGLICQSLARWLTTRGEVFYGSPAFVRALALVAEEAALMGYADDAVQAQWFPAGFTIVEQGERGDSLHLVIAGHVDVIEEQAGDLPHMIRRLGPGQFFGAVSLATGRPHAASYVASDTVTCLTLSSQAPTAFDARGAHAGEGAEVSVSATEDLDGLVQLDISACLDRKVAALVAHHTQFAIEDELSTLAPMWRLMSREYFERVVYDAHSLAGYARCGRDALTVGSQPLLALPA